MITINILQQTGPFAENKDVAQSIRTTLLIPSLQKGEEVVIDFSGVTGTTQSFVHALISDPIRQFGSGVLDKISFKDCVPVVSKIITIVADYMQESEL